jgi:hypothetical protein
MKRLYIVIVSTIGEKSTSCDEAPREAKLIEYPISVL